MVLFWVAALLPSSAARNASEWASRTIYQLLTDRFAGSTSSCQNLGDYCGGTFKGIVDKLDYIKGMGFDAIWISPFVENTPKGYHGYWAKDFYRVNSHFGTAQELRDLVAAAHSKGIWVMADIVANHAGPIGSDFSQISPFNKSSDYHPTCEVSHYDCFTDEVLKCRLADLPDLNQDNPSVRKELLNWATWIETQFGFDGLRADTVMYIDQQFWTEFSNAAKVYIIGEVYSSLECNVAYQKKGIAATLSYPMYFTLRSVFQNGESMNEIEGQWKNYQAFPNLNVLGTFIDNHDQPRFLSGHSDKIQAYKNALAYVLLGSGIPIVYYGTEQHFSGGNDPHCREPLWASGYSTSTELYAFIKNVIGFRRRAEVWRYQQVQRYSTDHFYAFTRGQYFVALTNQNNQVSYPITYHPYGEGTRLCEVFHPTDCLTVQQGKFQVTLSNGEPKFYEPK